MAVTNLHDFLAEAWQREGSAYSPSARTFIDATNEETTRKRFRRWVEVNLRKAEKQGVIVAHKGKPAWEDLVVSIDPFTVSLDYRSPSAWFPYYQSFVQTFNVTTAAAPLSSPSSTVRDQIEAAFTDAWERDRSRISLSPYTSVRIVRFNEWVKGVLCDLEEKGVIAADKHGPAWWELDTWIAPSLRDTYRLFFKYRTADAPHSHSYRLSLPPQPASPAPSLITKQLAAIESAHILSQETPGAHHVRLSVPDFRWLMCAVAQLADRISPTRRDDPIDVQYHMSERALGYGLPDPPAVPDRVALVPFASGYGTWSLNREISHWDMDRGTYEIEEIEAIDGCSYPTERDAIRAISAYYERKTIE